VPRNRGVEEEPSFEIGDHRLLTGGERPARGVVGDHDPEVPTTARVHPSRPS
jgi:hypothetical protein